MGPRKRSKTLKRAALVGVLVVPVALIAVAWVALPDWIEERAADVIDRVGETLDVDIRYGSLRIDGPDRVVLTDVVLRPRDALAGEADLASAATITIDIDAGSLLSGKARLTAITFEQPGMVLMRRADGTDNYGQLQQRLERLVRPGEGEGPATGDRGIWRVLDKHLPPVKVVGGEVRVEDHTASRSLIPRALPPILLLKNVAATALNETVMLDKLKLKLDVVADVPLVESRAQATLTYDRQTQKLGVRAELVTPSRLAVGDHNISVDRVAWSLGGALRLNGVHVGDELANISEVTLWFRDPPEATVASTPLEAVFSRLGKVSVIEPVIRVGGPVALWIDDAIGSRTPGRVPAAGARQPTPRERPKLQKKGEKVRTGLASGFNKLAATIRAGGRAAYAVGRKFPLPELNVRLGRFVYPDGTDGLKGALAGLNRFDLKVKRQGDSLAVAELSFVGEDGKAATAETLTARLQLETGDLQIHLKAESLPIAPYRGLLPSSVQLARESKLTNTDLRILYGAVADRLELHGEVNVDGLSVHIPAVARKPMQPLALGASLNVTLDLRTATLAVKDTIVRVSGVPVSLTLDASDLAEAPELSWTVKLKRISAQAVVDALPDALLGQLDELKLGGELSFKNSGRLDTRDMASLEYKSKTRDFGFSVKTLGKKVDFETITRRFVHRVQEPDGSVHEFTTGPGARGFTRFKDVSPMMAKVLTTTEDGTFWRHGGLAFFAVKDALIDNLEQGRFYRGASTLTQQLVKNVFLIREKTIARKLQEMFIAWRMEHFLSKERILELYLNIVELGPGIYGIRKAARHYFGKSPDELDVVECAFLASLLPNPRKYYYQYRRGEVTEAWRKGLERTVRVMRKRDKLTDAEVEAAAPFSPEFRRRRKGKDG